MREPDAQISPAAFPAADALPLHTRQAFDANRRWYDEYLSLVRGINDQIILNAQLYRYIAHLQEATKTALRETDGGSFLSAQTKEELSALLKEEISATWLMSHS